VGCWVTLSAVLDRSSQRIQLFINGDADPSVPAQFDYRQTDFTAAIGNNRWQDGQYRVLNGCVENVIFYDEPVIPEPMGAWWTFDEGSGDILHDVTENGNDAANIGGSWSHVPYLGSALDLTDASDIVRGIPETFDDQALEGFTVCVGMTWHGPTGTSCYIFDSRTQDAGFNLMIGQDRHLYFQIYDEGAHVQQIRSVNEVPAERPVCVGAMFDRIQHQLQLFINGQADDVVAAEFDYFDTYLSAAIGNNRWYDGQWRVANASIDDVVFYNAPVRPRLMGMLAGVEEQLPAIEGSWLGLPFPNPVRDAATLVFTLAKACPVDASIWTVDGRAITTLIHGWLPEGEHRATWCGVDDQGRRIPAGVYYLRVQAGDRSQMQRISVLR
jgi:hypothetical protein